MNSLFNQLSQFGLTKLEIKAYISLAESGALPAKELADTLSVSSNAIYRVLKGLINKGFVSRIQEYPIRFQAISFQVAGRNAVEKQALLLRDVMNNPEIILQSIRPDSSPTEIQMVYGSDNIYEEGALLLSAAKTEMLVISIGEPISPQLLLAVKDAKERKVAIKMIAHVCDETNIDILHNLKKNGYEIRHSSGWGFHMAIYDQSKTLLIINNPENTSERAAMYINSPGLSKALSDYFHSVWEKATVI